MKFINQIICGDALEIMKQLKRESIHLIITSPPYWNLVDYGFEGQIGQSSYEQYIQDLLDIWIEADRVLIPNGKLCINTPIVPIKKEVINDQHTRHIKNINNDIEYSILNNTSFQRFSLYIWQKQTTEKMFGSYPYPPNIYENNTIEFMNVLVKPGEPRKIPKEVKEYSKLSMEEWMDLTRQVWYIYPEDVSRSGGHPAPFPVKLPARLIAMYTFGAVKNLDFKGDIILDMFNGTGATCVAAKAMGRRYIGIDKSEEYCKIARQRVEITQVSKIDLFTKKIKFENNQKQYDLSLEQTVKPSLSKVIRDK
ncbi:MAG: site-specific DNA-methyltransferase [candidate division Zixibacteria bacterium]|nr:site-specific DNA-methyltransferase [candidate division Zixibacteria bacterium]